MVINHLLTGMILQVVPRYIVKVVESHFINFRDMYLLFENHPHPPFKNPPTVHYTGWLIGILIMVYCNPYIIG